MQNFNKPNIKTPLASDADAQANTRSEGESYNSIHKARDSALQKCNIRAGLWQDILNALKGSNTPSVAPTPVEVSLGNLIDESSFLSSELTNTRISLHRKVAFLVTISEMFERLANQQENHRGYERVKDYYNIEAGSRWSSSLESKLSRADIREQLGGLSTDVPARTFNLEPVRESIWCPRRSSHCSRKEAIFELITVLESPVHSRLRVGISALRRTTSVGITKDLLVTFFLSMGFRTGRSMWERVVGRGVEKAGMATFIRSLKKLGFNGNTTVLAAALDRPRAGIATIDAFITFIHA